MRVTCVCVWGRGLSNLAWKGACGAGEGTGQYNTMERGAAAYEPGFWGARLRGKRGAAKGARVGACAVSGAEGCACWAKGRGRCVALRRCGDQPFLRAPEEEKSKKWELAKRRA